MGALGVADVWVKLSRKPSCLKFMKAAEKPSYLKFVKSRAGVLSPVFREK